MPIFAHDSLNFNYVDIGDGTPFIFQHGLGGDVNQTQEVYTAQPGIRLISFDARGHGETRPLCSEEKLSFNQFADDLIALADYLGLAQFVVGGISMGAGIALNVAVRYPDRVRALIFSRPAWLDAPHPPNLDPLAHIGKLIREVGIEEGLTQFRASDEYTQALAEAPDVAGSFIRQFEHPRAAETAIKLVRMIADAPTYERASWGSIRVPTLILVNQIDPLHPYEFGTTLAAAIPGAVAHQLTSKSINKAEHMAQCQQAIADFLRPFATES